MYARVLVAGLFVVGGALFLVLNASADRWGPSAASPQETSWEEVSRRGEALRSEPLPAPLDRLVPLAVAKGRPGPDDWLAQHEEEGQSLAQWRASDPVRVTPERRTIYLQPVGNYTEEEEAVVALTSDYVERFFGVPVTTLPAWSAQSIPESARRKNPLSGQSQLWTEYVLKRLLDARPPDALALLALTAEDLYPAEDWNFVFGQASLTERIGVWSAHRNGDPAGTEAERALYLRRTLATATHELAHMLGILHCVAWECLANGINHQEEADRAPLGLCPHDLAKLTEATGVDPLAHHEALAEFWKGRDAEEHARFARGAEALRIAPGAEAPAP